MCQPEPCKNLGKCSNRRTDFYCSCAPGFTGKTCETSKYDCLKFESISFLVLVFELNIKLDYSTSKHIKLHYITLHYITLHYITLHYITLHYITLHYITLHFITLHYITLHYITLHYITLHYITVHYITLHYITSH